MEWIVGLSQGDQPASSAAQFDTLVECRDALDRWTVNMTHYLQERGVMVDPPTPLYQAAQAGGVAFMLGNSVNGWYAFASCSRTDQLTPEGRAAVQSSP